jgi:putative Mn2+ efflux pump MntP
MTIESALFLLGFSFCHVFFPGHPTPLLLATGSMSSRNAWKFTWGIALAHGLVMAVALATGQVFLKALQEIWPSGKFWLSHMDIPLLLILGFYMIREAFHKDDESETAGFANKFNPKRPFATGLAIGSIPCPDTIGYAMIGGAIGLKGMSHALTATSLVFFGTCAGFLLVTLAAQSLPRLIRSPRLGQAICIGTAIICFLNVAWRSWNTYRDWA